VIVELELVLWICWKGAGIPRSPAALNLGSQTEDEFEFEFEDD
jgi:hypothetical protein